MTETGYQITHFLRGGRKSWCLPVGMDGAGMQDISTIGQRWAVLVDPATGRTYDCNAYYDLHLGIQRWEDE